MDNWDVFFSDMPKGRRRGSKKRNSRRWKKRRRRGREDSGTGNRIEN